MFIEIVTVAAFLAICLTVFVIGDLLTRGRRSTYRATFDESAVSMGTVSSSRPSKLRLWFMQGLAGVVPHTDKGLEKTQQDLKRAGYYKSTAMIEYLATRNGLIVAVLIATIVLALTADPGTNTPKIIMIIGFVTAGFGFGLPRMMLHWQASNRVERIQKGLPDALDLVTMCITGGLSLRDSLDRASRELRLSHPDVAVEFAIMHRQADADSLPRALKQFAKRMNAPDISALSLMVAQTEKLGTNVSTAICDYADSVRQSQRQRAQERASKTSIKMLFPVIFCMLPPVFVLLCGPPVLKLYGFVKTAHEDGGILNPSTLNSIEPLPQSLDLDEYREQRESDGVSQWGEIRAEPDFDPTAD